MPLGSINEADKIMITDRIDSNLSECKLALQQCYDACGLAIDQAMYAADTAIQDIHTVINGTVVTWMMDAGDEIVHALEVVDLAATQAMILAYVAAQQAGCELPNIQLEALEAMGFATQLPKRKSRNAKTADVAVQPVSQSLTPIPDPGVKTGMSGTAEWKATPAVGNCEKLPTQQQQNPTYVGGSSTLLPADIVLSPTGGVPKYDPVPIGGLGTGQGEGSGSTGIITPVGGLGGQSPTQETPGNTGGDVCPPCPVITVSGPACEVHPTSTYTPIITPPIVPEPIIGSPGAVGADWLGNVVAPTVIYPGDIKWETNEDSGCIVSDRWFAIRKVAVTIGEKLIRWKAETHGYNLAHELLMALADEYMQTTPLVRKEWSEKVGQFINSGGMGWFGNTWIDGLRKVVGDKIDDVMRLMAVRAFLNSALNSPSILQTKFNQTAGTSGNEKTSTKGTFGLGLPEGIPILQVGQQVSTGVDLNVSQGRNIDAGYSVSIVIYPFLFPLIQVIDQMIDSELGLNGITPNQGVDCYLRGGMSYPCLKSIIVRNGGDMSEWDSVIKAFATKLGTGDIIQAWRRGLLTSDQRDKRLRREGWIHSDEASMAVELSEYIPGPQDLIRFMVRDVADDDIVRDFKLDSEFPEKWKGELKRKGFSQGITDATAKDYWRAHWDLPGMSAVYQSLHRFRDDGTFDGPKELITTKPEVSKILAYNDMLPVWRDRLVALSYSPLTRVDAQRSFMIGVIDKDRLYKAFRDIGYDDFNASTLVAFTIQRRMGYLLASKPSKYYRDGSITADQLKSRLNKFSITADELKEVIETLELDAKQKVQLACQKAMREKYMHGGYSNKEAKEELIRRGFPQSHVERTVAGWDCERDANSKEVPAAKLCDFFKSNLIDSTEYQVRLIRLGYSKADARMLAQLCGDKEAVKLSKEKARDDASKERAEDAANKMVETKKVRDEKDDARREKREATDAVKLAARKKVLRNLALSLSGALGIDVIAAVESVEIAVDRTADYLEIPREAAEKVVADAGKFYWPRESGDWMQYIQNVWEQYAKINTD